MKIVVKDGKGKGFSLYLPIFIVSKLIKYQLKDGEEKSLDANELIKVLKECKKTFGNLELVNIKSKNNDVVKIRL